LPLLVILFSLAGFAMPTATLILLKNNAGINAPPDGLHVRQAKYEHGTTEATPSNKEYITKTKAAITRQLRASGHYDSLKVTKLVFTSEKSRWIAAQRQVGLSFTYELKYKGKQRKNLKEYILFASDEVGNLFDNAIEI